MREPGTNCPYAQTVQPDEPVTAAFGESEVTSPDIEQEDHRCGTEPSVTDPSTRVTMKAKAESRGREGIQTGPS